MAREEKKQLLEEKNIHLWFEGSPVALCTMRLELNIDRGAIFAYSKMMNVQPEHIKEAVFDIICYDSVRMIVDTLIDLKYVNLDIPRNGVFGMDTPIRIRNVQTRNVEFVIKSVTTVSGQTWNNEEKKRFNMSLEQESIYNVLGDLHKQFLENCTRENVDQTKLILNPKFEDMYWLCACGALNWSDEEKCSGCGVNKNWLIVNTVQDNLRKQDDRRKVENEKIRQQAAEKERLEKERQRQEFEKRKADYANQKKKQDGMGKSKAALIIVIVTLILAGAGLGTYLYVIPYFRYNNAVTAMNNGKFDEAISKFDKMKGYLDSDELRNKCVYSKATNEFYGGSKEKAAELFQSIPGYMDSDDMYVDSELAIADELIASEDYLEAYKIYMELGLIDDERANKCKENLYNKGREEMKLNHLNAAFEIYTVLGDYKKSSQLLKECKYRLAQREYDNTHYKNALLEYEEIKDYKDVNAILKKLNNLSIILSASSGEENPAVWDAFKQKCPNCGKEAQYICEFYEDGSYKFTVRCEDQGHNQELTGKYKIEDDKIYVAKYVNGISTWSERGTISKVNLNETSVDGKNASVQTTDFINEHNKQPVIIYGNKISGDMMKTG